MQKTLNAWQFSITVWLKSPCITSCLDETRDLSMKYLIVASTLS